MTSVQSPTQYALHLARSARQSLDAATAALVGGDIRPQDPRRIGIPEHNGPNTPDNPWFIGRPTPVGSIQRATTFAGEALRHIDAALDLGSTNALGDDVRVAFSHAKTQAMAGVSNLDARAAVDLAHVKVQFDSSKVWLDTAAQLLQLNAGSPPYRPHPAPDAPVARPLPIPPIDSSLPGAPEEPYRRPVTIQLPSPDSEIQ